MSQATEIRRVRRETFLAAVARAGLSVAGLAKAIGMSRQALHAMVAGKIPLSTRVVRDAPIVIAARTEGVSADALRSALFGTDSDPKGETAHG